MDTEKTNTQTEAESLNSSTPPTAEAVTDEEKDFYNGLIYSLFNESADEMGKQTEAEKAEYNEMLAHFAELEGVRKKSPYVMMYAGFYLGVGKGLELAARMERNA